MIIKGAIQPMWRIRLVGPVTVSVLTKMHDYTLETAGNHVLCHQTKFAERSMCRNPSFSSRSSRTGTESKIDPSSMCKYLSFSSEQNEKRTMEEEEEDEKITMITIQRREILGTRAVKISDVHITSTQVMYHPSRMTNYYNTYYKMAAGG